MIELTTLRSQYEVRTEHDFTNEPRRIDMGGGDSLLAALVQSDECARRDSNP